MNEPFQRYFLFCVILLCFKASADETPCNIIDNTNKLAVYLDRHTVQCPDGKGLSKFRFTVEGCNAGFERAHYVYECNDFALTVGEVLVRDPQEDEACVVLTDLQNVASYTVECDFNAGEFLWNFQVISGCDGPPHTWARYYRTYRYQCARLSNPSPHISYTTIQKQTRCSTIVDSPTFYLDQHTIDCGSRGYVAKFQLTRSDCCCDEYRYEYTCVEFERDCTPTNVRAQWQVIGSANAETSFEYETGVSHTSTTEFTTEESREWATETELSVTQGFEYGVRFLGSGTTGSTEFGYAQVDSQSTTRTVASLFSDEFQSTETQTQSFTFPTGGVIWQWQFETTSACGPSLIKAGSHLRATPSQGNPPCCIPTFEADVSNPHGACVPSSDGVVYNSCDPNNFAPNTTTPTTTSPAITPTDMTTITPTAPTPTPTQTFQTPRGSPTTRSSTSIATVPSALLQCIFGMTLLLII